jgi:hypothetical protein
MTTPVVIMDGSGANAKAIPVGVLGGTFVRAAAVSSTPGAAVLVSGVTTAGTVTLTLPGGSTVVESVPLGSTRLPYGVTAAVTGTAVGSTFQSLFYS